MLTHLRGETPESLQERWPDLGLDARSARRVMVRAVADDADVLGQVRGQARHRADAVAARSRLDRLEVVDRRASEIDPFLKYLFKAADGAVFEAVRIPLLQPRWSACVSSQAGCALRCAFCATGRMGLLRNLEAWEIVDQVLTIRREAPERPLTGVVFQGQGEPFHNYDNVMRAIDVLRHPCGGRIRGDRMTISTVGLLPQIERYTDEGRPCRLILSLTSAFQDKRASLLPVAGTWQVGDVAQAMRRHAAIRGGVVSVAWVLMSGVNTGTEEAAELARLFAGAPLRVSVIDVNDPTGRFARAGDAERGAFLGALASHGIPFVRRYSGGPDIAAACGMLASSAQGGTTVAEGHARAAAGRDA